MADADCLVFPDLAAFPPLSFLLHSRARGAAELPHLSLLLSRALGWLEGGEVVRSPPRAVARVGLQAAPLSEGSRFSVAMLSSATLSAAPPPAMPMFASPPQLLRAPVPGLLALPPPSAPLAVAPQFDLKLALLSPAPQAAGSGNPPGSAASDDVPPAGLLSRAALRVSARAAKPSMKALALAPEAPVAEPPSKFGIECCWWDWRGSSPLELNCVAVELRVRLGDTLLPPGWMVLPSAEAGARAAFADEEGRGAPVGLLADGGDEALDVAPPLVGDSDAIVVWDGPAEAAAAASTTRGMPGRLAVAEMRAAATDASGVIDCDALISALIGQTRNRKTFAAYRNPFLKAVLWLAAHNEPVAPPSAKAVAHYLAMLVATQQNIGAPCAAQRAINYVCGLNEWPLVGSSAIAQIPTDAARRMFAKPTRKSFAFSLELLARVFNHLVPGGFAAMTATPEAMRATAYVHMFVNVNRYADTVRCQFGDEYLTVTVEDEVPVVNTYVDYQKNDQFFKGLIVSTAQSDCTLFGGGSAFDVFVAAKALFKEGPILRRIKGGRNPVLAPPFSNTIKGYVGKKMPAYMTYNDFVKHLRSDLEACGLTPAEAAAYTAHSFRAGAVTGLAEADAAEQVIMDRAGTTSAGWLAGYHRVSLKKRAEASRALGV